MRARPSARAFTDRSAGLRGLPPLLLALALAGQAAAPAAQAASPDPRPAAAPAIGRSSSTLSLTAVPRQIHAVPGYRLCALPAGVCAAASALGVPTVLDTDGDGVPDVVADLVPLSSTSPAEVGLHAKIVRLAMSVPQHLYVEVMTGDAPTTTVRVGVDGREASIPSAVSIDITSTKGDAEETVISLRSTAMAADAPWSLTAASASDSSHVDLAVPGAPDSLQGVVTTSEVDGVQEIGWDGDPVEEVQVTWGAPAADVALRMEDVPAEVDLTIGPEVEPLGLRSLDLVASAPGMDLFAETTVVVTETIAASSSVSATDLGGTVRIGGTPAGSVVFASSPPAGRVALTGRASWSVAAQRANFCRPSCGGIHFVADDVHSALSIEADLVTLAVTDLSELEVAMVRGLLKVSGAYGQMEFDISGDRTVAYDIGMRAEVRFGDLERRWTIGRVDRADTIHVTAGGPGKFIRFHTFTPGRETAHHATNVTCSILPRRDYRVTIQTSPDWRGASRGGFSLSGSMGRAYILMDPGDVLGSNHRLMAALLLDGTRDGDITIQTSCPG